MIQKKKKCCLFTCLPFVPHLSDACSLCETLCIRFRELKAIAHSKVTHKGARACCHRNCGYSQYVCALIPSDSHSAHTYTVWSKQWKGPCAYCQQAHESAASAFFHSWGKCVCWWQTPCWPCMQKQTYAHAKKSNSHSRSNSLSSVIRLPTKMDLPLLFCLVTKRAPVCTHTQSTCLHTPCCLESDSAASTRLLC